MNSSPYESNGPSKKTSTDSLPLFFSNNSTSSQFENYCSNVELFFILGLEPQPEYTAQLSQQKPAVLSMWPYLEKEEQRVKKYPYINEVSQLVFPYEQKISRVKVNEEQSSEFGFSKLFGSATKNKANLKATSKIEKPDIKHISMTPGDLGKRYMSCLIINEPYLNVADEEFYFLERAYCVVSNMNEFGHNERILLLIFQNVLRKPLRQKLKALRDEFNRGNSKVTSSTGPLQNNNMPPAFAQTDRIIWKNSGLLKTDSMKPEATLEFYISLLFSRLSASSGEVIITAQNMKVLQAAESLSRKLSRGSPSRLNSKTRLASSTSCQSLHSNQEKPILRFHEYTSQQAVRFTPQNYAFESIFQKIKPEILVQLVCVVLLERKLMLVVQDTSKVSVIIEALLTLISPLEWTFMLNPYISQYILPEYLPPFPWITSMTSAEWKSYKKLHQIQDCKNERGKYPGRKKDENKDSGFFGTGLFSQKTSPNDTNIFTQEHPFQDAIVYSINGGKFLLNPELIPELPEPAVSLLIKDLKAQLNERESYKQRTKKNLQKLPQETIEHASWVYVTLKAKQLFFNFMLQIIGNINPFFKEKKLLTHQRQFSTECSSAPRDPFMSYASGTSNNNKSVIEERLSCASKQCASDIFDFQAYLESVSEVYRSFVREMIQHQNFNYFLEQIPREDKKCSRLHYFLENLRVMTKNSFQILKRKQNQQIVDTLKNSLQKPFVFSLEKVIQLYRLQLSQASRTVTPAGQLSEPYEDSIDTCICKIKGNLVVKLPPLNYPAMNSRRLEKQFLMMQSSVSSNNLNHSFNFGLLPGALLTTNNYEETNSVVKEGALQSKPDFLLNQEEMLVRPDSRTGSLSTSISTGKRNLTFESIFRFGIQDINKAANLDKLLFQKKSSQCSPGQTQREFENSPNVKKVYEMIGQDSSRSFLKDNFLQQRLSSGSPLDLSISPIASARQTQPFKSMTKSEIAEGSHHDTPALNLLSSLKESPNLVYLKSKGGRKKNKEEYKMPPTTIRENSAAPSPIQQEVKPYKLAVKSNIQNYSLSPKMSLRQIARSYRQSPQSQLWIAASPQNVHLKPPLSPKYYFQIHSKKNAKSPNQPPLAPISQFDLFECRSEEEEDREDQSGIVTNQSGTLTAKVMVKSVRGLKAIHLPLRTPSKSASSAGSAKALRSKMIQFKYNSSHIKGEQSTLNKLNDTFTEDSSIVPPTQNAPNLICEIKDFPKRESLGKNIKIEKRLPQLRKLSSKESVISPKNTEEGCNIITTESDYANAEESESNLFTTRKNNSFSVDCYKIQPKTLKYSEKKQIPAEGVNSSESLISKPFTKQYKTKNKPNSNTSRESSPSRVASAEKEDVPSSISAKVGRLSLIRNSTLTLVGSRQEGAASGTKKQLHFQNKLIKLPDAGCVERFIKGDKKRGSKRREMSFGSKADFKYQQLQRPRSGSIDIFSSSSTKHRGYDTIRPRIFENNYSLGTSVRSELKSKIQPGASYSRLQEQSRNGIKIFPARNYRPDVLGTPSYTSAKQIGTFEKRNQMYPIITTDLAEIEENRCHTIEAVSPKAAAVAEMPRSGSSLFAQQNVNLGELKRKLFSKKEKPLLKEIETNEVTRKSQAFRSVKTTIGNNHHKILGSPPGTGLVQKSGLCFERAMVIPLSRPRCISYNMSSNGVVTRSELPGTFQAFSQISRHHGDTDNEPYTPRSQGSENEEESDLSSDKLTLRAEEDLSESDWGIEDRAKRINSIKISLKKKTSALQ